MAHTHTHDHSVDNLKTAFFLNLGFTLFEIVGGLYVNSVAILADAVQDLGDSLSLGSSWYLQQKSKQAASKSFSFGYKRFSLLSALINSVVLVAGSVYVIYAAVERILAPESSYAPGMLLFALVGIAVNGYAAWKMSHGKTMNERVVSWHLIEDVLGWVAVLMVSIVLLFKDIPLLDPLLSLGITLYILWNVGKRLKETLYLFLQGHPKDIDQKEIEREILTITHVNSVHHTHIWSLDGEHHVFSTHVKLNGDIQLPDLLSVKNQLKTILQKYPFTHSTVETELEMEVCGDEDAMDE